MTTTTGAMSPTNPTGTSVNYASMQMGSGTASDKTSMSSTDYMSLLVTQLKNQDPSSPTDDSQIMQQTASLSEMQAINSLTTVLQQQYALQQKSDAASYVGKQVTYTDSTGVAHTGTAVSATFTGATPVLNIGGKTVDLADVAGISSGTTSTASTGATPPTS